MKAYSPYFKTLHDEQSPVGNLGRGTHYSVLEVIQWKDLDQKPLEKAHKQRIAVIWDEDHDERIIPLLEKAYLDGNLSPVCAVGERKGNLNVIVNPLFYGNRHNSVLKYFGELGYNIPDDDWSTETIDFFNASKSGIINDSEQKINIYLKNINMLWDLF